METPNCSVCQKPKASFSCGICEQKTCKKCTETLAKDSFSFLKVIPDHLSHKTYCGPCYDQKVGPELQKYNSTMARARQVFVYGKVQSEETRLMPRKEKPVQVENCADKEETLLRLAFLAADAGFNTLLDVIITHKKVRNEGYQSTSWFGSGIPTTLDAKKMEKNTYNGR